MNLSLDKYFLIIIGTFFDLKLIIWISQYNNLIRVAQNNGINNLGDNQYGQEMSLNNIKDISPDSFKEEFIKKIKPTFKENILGMHHMSGIKDFTVFDYCKYDKIT